MAERYDRDLTDLFELQDEIVRAIAGAIEPELLKYERERIAEQPQLNEDAYERRGFEPVGFITGQTVNGKCHRGPKIAIP
jgi:hypothetical protein